MPPNMSFNAITSKWSLQCASHRTCDIGEIRCKLEKNEYLD